MPFPCSVSVILSTYNRAAQLGPALDHLLAQGRSAPSHEVIVVDNNSTDTTRQVVEARVARAGGHLRYVFESKQGLSYARNAGILAARGDIIAFTDDDVRVSPEWVQVVAQAFEMHSQ